MKEENTEIQPEETASDSLEMSTPPAPPEPVEETAPPPPADTVEEPIKAEKPEQTKFQKVLRKVLIWMAGIALIFLAGILTSHYLSVVPLRESIAEDQRVVEEAHAAETTALQDELDIISAYQNLTQVLVDVNNARIALFLDDFVGAKASLAHTQDNLGTLLDMIADFDEGLVTSMPQRLDLIISGLERDGETARVDLELFTKDLLDIEKAIFGN